MGFIAYDNRIGPGMFIFELVQTRYSSMTWFMALIMDFSKLVLGLE